MKEKKAFLYFIIFIAWIYLAKILMNFNFKLFVIYILLTITVYIYLNIKNKKIIKLITHYRSVNRRIKKLKCWYILEDNKISHLSLIKDLNSFSSNLLCFVTILFFLSFSLIASFINSYVLYFLLIIYLLYASAILLKMSVLRFPIFTALIIPFISIIVPLYINDLRIITNLLHLKLIYIVVATFLYIIMCLIARPYAIEKINRNLLFINGLPNLILLILTISLSTIKKTKLNFTKQEGFNRLPNELQTILSNKYFTNQIRDIFFQTELNKVTSEISADILIATLVIFIFTIILKTRLRLNQFKARKKLNYIRFKELLNENITYEEYKTISYFGGEYYEDLIFTMPNALSCIYQKEKKYIKNHNSILKRHLVLFIKIIDNIKEFWKYILRKFK